MKRIARIVLVFTEIWIWRAMRTLFFTVVFTVLIFSATWWSTAPKGPDPSAKQEEFCAQFKVGMNQQQVQAVLDRYGHPYDIGVWNHKSSFVEGNILIESRYGVCSLVVDRNGIVSSVVTVSIQNAFEEI